jgi:ATP-dependent exoDNAse (exonuclease V) beta subunit
LPYRVEGGRTFFGRREVLDCLAVLHAIDTAADPVAVYAALHSQLFAFSDDDLYAFHAAGGSFDYLGAAPPAGFPEIAAALADLRALHERRNLRPPAETLDELVRRTRLLESLALWADDAEQAIGNVAELVSLADEFAHSAEATFHAFVAKMARDVGAADTAESPVGEAGDFVRLTTVHKAKGLEFPVVVLASAMLASRAANRAALIDRAARLLARMPVARPRQAGRHCEVPDRRLRGALWPREAGSRRGAQPCAVRRSHAGRRPARSADRGRRASDGLSPGALAGHRAVRGGGRR